MNRQKHSPYIRILKRLALLHSLLLHVKIFALIAKPILCIDKQANI
jgi:hypothetical protein